MKYSTEVEEALLSSNIFDKLSRPRNATSADDFDICRCLPTHCLAVEVGGVLRTSNSPFAASSRCPLNRLHHLDYFEVYTRAFRIYSGAG